MDLEQSEAGAAGFYRGLEVVAGGWWNIEAPGITLMSGLSLRASATLGMLCTKVMLIDAGYNHAIDDLRRQWEKVNDDRNWVFYNPELPGE